MSTKYLKLRPSTLQQIRAECDYAFIYHRDSAGRPAVTHCILCQRETSIYCRGFAILSPLDIKLGQVRKRRGEMVALGRAWKALQTGVSFGPIGRAEVDDLITDLIDPLEDPPNPILDKLVDDPCDFYKAQYDINPLYEEHEALNARRPAKVTAVDWSTPELSEPQRQKPLEEVNRTLRALAKTEVDVAAEDPNATHADRVCVGVAGVFGETYWTPVDELGRA